MSDFCVCGNVQGAEPVVAVLLCVAAPRPAGPSQTAQTTTLLPTDRRKVRTPLPSTPPAQPTQPLVTRAARRTRPVLAFLHVVLFLHAEQALLFFDTLAADTAAADCAIETAESSAGAADAGAGGEAVDTRVLRV